MSLFEGNLKAVPSYVGGKRNFGLFDLKTLFNRDDVEFNQQVTHKTSWMH